MKEISILLIEDDELDVISFERALKKINLPIILYTAFNGIEALELLRGKQRISIPDIIVLDLNMPKMNGGEFLAELRKDSTFNDVKIFIMTTSNEDRDRSRGDEFGVTGYIIKPLNFNENTKRNVSMDNFMHFQIMKMVGDQLN
ncbi:MAG: response regulator [Sporocytophaga sp.]|uniref:response regulator n=1 Tax=Sporocytophaga sp. TaxID=2231183 RepID=UPI001B06C40A|nr:response regulator [Sporocytophaga sp.]MBO9700412.1 response regulator [Sporocytophaga sp.]